MVPGLTHLVGQVLGFAVFFLWLTFYPYDTWFRPGGLYIAGELLRNSLLICDLVIISFREGRSNVTLLGCYETSGCN
jgi:hypothetical protein